eukprot:SAG31_NODE_19742_length_592_cov_4.784990_1_plen_59_part_10
MDVMHTAITKLDLVRVVVKLLNTYPRTASVANEVSGLDTWPRGGIYECILLYHLYRAGG